MGLAVLWPLVEKLLPSSSLTGTITAISESVSSPLPHKIAEVKLQSGTVEAVIYEGGASYQIGEKVQLQEDGQAPGSFTIAERVRTKALAQLVILFLIVILLVSGWAGVRSLLGLLFSFVVIFQFVLPQIVAGGNPLTIALMASLIILLVSYFLTHGISDKSIIAIIGTFGALATTGILAGLFGTAAKLTGFGSEEAGFLLGQLPIESFYNLLLAGIMIGSLGVLDDITISQASIVAELSDANHRLRTGELYSRAMRIGHDHIASLVNTLVLVYTGSALPLLLLFVTSQTSTLELLNYEAVAEEIVRTLVGSIGLVTAVPLTTIIAAYWYGGKRR